MRTFFDRRYFNFITEQKVLFFMFDLKHSSKIKNYKIVRWRLETSRLSYDIQYNKYKRKYEYRYIL